MSSHHIVRDDQEPALIIANGEPCSQMLLDQLLEWSPLVIVLDSAIERVLERNIKVDVLLGDFDNGVQNLDNLQYPLEIVHTPDQNKTDLEKAIEYLIERKIPAVNIVWATGRRADHSISNMTNIVRFKDAIKIVMFDDYSKIYRLPNTFKKWYVKDTIISLIPVGTATNIRSQNLTYPLDGITLTLGYKSGSSNSVVQDGIVEITYGDGDLLMMECTD